MAKANHWTTPPDIRPCPQCETWTLTGSTIHGERVTVTLDAMTPLAFAAWASSKPRPALHRIVNGGVVPVHVGDGSTMADWRTVHPCAALGDAGKDPGPSRHRANPIPGSGVNGPHPPRPQASETATPATGHPSDLGVDGGDLGERRVGAAAALLSSLLGAVVVERERGGRVVHRRP